MSLCKKISLVAFLFFICLLVYHYEAINYGLMQAKGQYVILRDARPISQILDDSLTADSIKTRLNYINAVKQFAVNGLGLEASENYTTFYDQKGKPILWMLTASPEFKIESYQWSFPIAGTFDYKGFFDFQKAKLEEKELQKKGYDTNIDEVAAWSTLGWFSDPILSSMLERSDGRLAELIIHESTHATIYIKDQVTYNESLANYIGKKGALEFLKFHFRHDSSRWSSYQKRQKKSKLFRQYMINSIDQLNEIYQQLPQEWSLEQKRAKKRQAIEKIKMGLIDIGYFSDSMTALKKIKQMHLNNAYFSGMSTYNSKYNEFDSIVNNSHHGSLKDFIRSVVEEHGSIYF